MSLFRRYRPADLRGLKGVHVEPLNLRPITNDSGYSEERCVRCGWHMGSPALNCQNDNTPHVFPSQLPATVRDELQRLNTRLTETNRDRHQWRERAISAEQQLALHGPSDELQRLRRLTELQPYETERELALVIEDQEAELQRLREVANAAEKYRLGEKRRREAAEAKVRRLTDGLREPLSLLQGIDYDEGSRIDRAVEMIDALLTDSPEVEA